MYMYSNVLVLFLLLNLVGNVSYAQFKTDVTLGGQIEASLKTKFEHHTSLFLTDINQAYNKNQKPSIKNNYISSGAISSILSMWEMSPFRCYETEIVERLISRPSGGYEIRNIPVLLSKASEDNKYQEIAIIFNNQGIIEDLYFTIESNRYTSIITSGKDLPTEYRRRQIIVDFIENFRTAYNRKDSKYLDNIFSEDALIITGKVVKSVEKDASSGLLSQETITYQKQTKLEYLIRLKEVFKLNSYINIKFNDIEIRQHDRIPALYGVQLFQEWNTSKYSDAGYILLVVDFSNEYEPKIHVRTWQPEKLNGRRLKDEERIRMEQLPLK